LKKLIGLALELPPLRLGFIEQAAPAGACGGKGQPPKIRIDILFEIKRHR
jgi:hypothetical protein